MPSCISSFCKAPPEDLESTSLFFTMVNKRLVGFIELCHVLLSRGDSNSHLGPRALIMCCSRVGIGQLHMMNRMCIQYHHIVCTCRVGDAVPSISLMGLRVIVTVL